MTIERPALRYHGGKFRLATWLMKMFPTHQTYVEPFGGGAGVLLRKPRSHLEVYNDLDGDVVTFFRVLQDTALRDRLAERLAFTPFARAEFDRAYEPTVDPLERAARVAVRSWMGYGSAGAAKSTTGFRMSAIERVEASKPGSWHLRAYHLFAGSAFAAPRKRPSR